MPVSMMAILMPSPCTPFTPAQAAGALMRGTLTAFSWVNVPTRSTWTTPGTWLQRFDLVLRDADLESVDRALEAADDTAAGRFDLAALAGLFGATLRLDGQSFFASQAPRGGFLLVGDRRSIEDCHDRDRRGVQVSRYGQCLGRDGDGNLLESAIGWARCQ